MEACQKIPLQGLFLMEMPRATVVAKAKEMAEEMGAPVGLPRKATNNQWCGKGAFAFWLPSAKEYMARPQKMRKVCAAPCKRRFGPLGDGTGPCGVVQLTVDEYEVIRLIDYEGLLQEACAEKMQVARTTVQAMYGTARKKLAIMLVEGAALRIEGGNVRLCEGTDLHCHKKGCCRFQRHLEHLPPPATEEGEIPGACPKKR